MAEGEGSVVHEWLDGALSVPGDVLVQELPDGESVFLNLATEEYFGLDATGTRMWNALSDSRTVDQALRRLTDEFDIDAETLRRHLHGLLEKLVARGLLVVDRP